jgi:hypothetical protein
VYDIFHTASSPGASDAFRARPGIGRERRSGLLRGGRPRRAGPAEPVEGGRLVAVSEPRLAEDRLDEALR